VLRGVLVAGTVVAVAVMAGLYLGLRPFLARPETPGGPPSALADPGAEVRRLADGGRRALGEGNFRLARGLLGEALQLRGRHPEAISEEEGRRLAQLHRQADLLADLLRVSLQEILRQAQSLRDAREWQEQLADYRGRSVVFDDVVRTDARGRPALAVYAVTAAGAPARLALEDLALWQRVPLETPRRVLFGARLAGCDREEGGGWVFHFQPDSGVLLTDSGAAAALCPEAPPGDLLRRQSEWLGP
jgi:hypothetical protein